MAMEPLHLDGIPEFILAVQLESHFLRTYCRYGRRRH